MKDQAQPPRQHPAGDGHHPDQLVGFLEPDQLVVDRRRPLPPARISRTLTAFLLFARVAVTVLAGMVIYTFVASLH